MMRTIFFVYAVSFTLVAAHRPLERQKVGPISDQGLAWILQGHREFHERL